MKKISVSILAVMMCLICLLTFAACQDSQYVGTYEMVSISGTMTAYGQTIELTKDLYEYYRITLNDDGTAKVQSKAANNTTAIEADGTWEVVDGKIFLKSTTSGITTVEEMTWEDGVITYSANQSAQGISMEMTIVLEKQQ